MVNSSPNDKILDESKLKAFPDIISNEAEELKFLLSMVKNIVGKGESLASLNLSSSNLLNLG